MQKLLLLHTLLSLNPSPLNLCIMYDLYSTEICRHGALRISLCHWLYGSIFVHV